MRIQEWPLYINDIGNVVCNAHSILHHDLHCEGPGVSVGSCDSWDWSSIGRRTDIGTFLSALKKHAKEAHGVEFEDNEVVAVRTPDGKNELVYDRRNITEFSTSRGIRETSCDEEGHRFCGAIHRRPTEDFTLTLKFHGLDGQPMWREVSDGG